MAYRLLQQEGVGEAAPRIATEQVELALEGLRDPDADRDEAIHDARKRLKQTRAVLRLVQMGLDEQTYQRDNVTLRDAGRLLSNARDAWVRVETLDRLIDHFRHLLGPGAYATTRAQLLEEYRAIVGGEVPAAALDALEEARLRIRAWAPSGDGLLAKGLEHTYRRGRDALRAAERETTTEQLHEWRKRVKDLSYQLRLVVPAWPGHLGALAEEAHRLSDLLGDDHDLGLFEDEVLDRTSLFDTPAGRDILADLVAQRRAELQTTALRLGGLLYVEKPKAFACRLAAIHRAWRTS